MLDMETPRTLSAMHRIGLTSITRVEGDSYDWLKNCGLIIMLYVLVIKLSKGNTIIAHNPRGIARYNYVNY